MYYIFGDYRLDTQRYELSQAGTLIPLQPKVFQVLAYLLAYHDRVVSKEELLEQLWPGQFVGDVGLNSYIMEVRKALGDRRPPHQVLHTVRGHGYRVVAPVEARDEAPPAPPLAGTLPLAVETPPPQDDTPLRPVQPDPARLAGADPVAACAGAASSAPRSSMAPRATHERRGQGVPDGERKLVTLLGCTLAHATALRARLGLDALHSRMRTLYTLTQQEVHQYGGIIHHVAGARLLAVFGVPVAQEDHARRAVLAAWGLHQRLAADRGGDPAEDCWRLAWACTRA